MQRKCNDGCHERGLKAQDMIYNTREYTWDERGLKAQDMIYNTRRYTWDERGCTAFVRMQNTNRVYVALVISLRKIRFLKQWNKLYGRWYGPSHCQHFLFKLRILCKRNISKHWFNAAIKSRIFNDYYISFALLVWRRT